MKKTIVALALCAVASSFAAESVTSANIVGFVKQEAPSGLQIVGMQFDSEIGNTPASVYGDTLPKGAKVYVFDGERYITSEYTDVFVPGTGVVVKWDAEIELNVGDGFWLELPESTNTIVSGDVPTALTITTPIVEGLQLLAYPYPVDRVITNLDFSPVKGDKIYVYNGERYVTSEYTDVFVPGTGLVLKWDVENIEIKAGVGFWYESKVASDWVVTRPYSVD